MRLFQRIIWYLTYFFHKIRMRLAPHSPEYHHWQQMMASSPTTTELSAIRNLQDQLESDQRSITYPDWGAGRHNQGSGTVTRSIKQLARLSSRTRNEGKFLYQVLSEFQPETALELGTHLGIGTLYQLAGAPDCRFMTIEGAEELAQLVRENWLQIPLSRYPELYVGQFDEVLPNILSPDIRLDYILIDGNHSYEPTLRYFRMLLPYLNPGGIMIFDDIYWSSGMKKAWDEIRHSSEISISIDLYQFGIIQKGAGPVATMYL